MPKWYDKYLSIYGKAYDELPNDIADDIKHHLAERQSANPLISVVVIAYNEERD